MDGLWARGERTKHQIPNTKLQKNPGIETPKTKLQTPRKSQVPSSKPPALRAWSFSGAWCLVFGVWNLELLWSLEFGVWSLNWRSLRFVAILRTAQNQRCGLELAVWDFFGTWDLELRALPPERPLRKNGRCIAP